MKVRTYLYLTAILSSLALSSGSAAQSLNSVRQGLVDDIQRAQSSLSEVQDSISSERQTLSQQINRAQNAVLDLRERAVAARRAADEETLSLNQIENRLEEWRNQNLFQTRLLTGFTGRVTEPGQQTDLSGSMQANVRGLRNYLQSIDDHLNPTWTQGRIASANGQLGSGDLLRVGPVVWFAQGDENMGLAEIDDDGLARILLPFSGSALAELQAYRSSGGGTLTFDPTLSQATLVAVEQESVLEHVEKGGIWVIPILAFALFATVTAILKAISLARLPRQEPALAERLEQAMANDTTGSITSRLRGTQAELADIALQPQTLEQRDERLYACLLDARSRLESWLGAIALTASVSPLLGLLGTVSGMITTFKLMTLFGAGDAASVSAGISEALVTTELGLVVAIPALIAHALMTRKVKGYYAQLETTAIRLSQLPVAGKAA